MPYPLVSNSPSTAPTVVPPEKRKRGRPRTVTVNPLFRILDQLLDPSTGRPAWLDGVLFGSILTAVGQSRNVSNVSMRDVLTALYLPTFETGVLINCGLQKRQAERVIQASRFAADGITAYLERNQPEEFKRLWDNADVEKRLSYHAVRLETYRPIKPVPEEILQLHRDGDYLAYGYALREFRLAN
ncbi:hypothetical protein [Pseudomonas putida]|uniref:hypothetical protein n=1 Tax=Pseudomonas putida TaxID=303 RepID=UPI0011B557B3|nr:hypothetical protein [Pseudomonas putida]